MNGLVEKHSAIVRAWLLPMSLVIAAPWAGLGCGGSTDPSSGAMTGSDSQSVVDSAVQATPVLPTAEDQYSPKTSQPSTDPTPVVSKKDQGVIQATALGESSSESGSSVIGGSVILPDPDSDTVGFEGPALGESHPDSLRQTVEGDSRQPRR